MSGVRLTFGACGPRDVLDIHERGALLLELDPGRLVLVADHLHHRLHGLRLLQGAARGWVMSAFFRGCKDSSTRKVSNMGAIIPRARAHTLTQHTLTQHTSNTTEKFFQKLGHYVTYILDGSPNDSAPANMPFMDVTCPVFHVERPPPRNSFASENISVMSVTLETSHS